MDNIIEKGLGVVGRYGILEARKRFNKKG